MDAERYRRVREIVHAADGREGSALRAFLDDACAGAADLRAAVERVLAPAVATDALQPHFESSLAGAMGVATGAAALDVPQRAGPYEIGAELGRGGMGVVHAATDTTDGSLVALKFVYPHLLAHPAAFERFAREAAIGKRLDHPNVVRALGLHAFEVDGDVLHAMAMEHVAGRSLRELLAELGAVPDGLLREIAVQVSAGLCAIHAAGIVHRDLKPENVIVTADQRVRIMDLGVARLEEASVGLTLDGQFVGSLAYAAPEQFDTGDVGPRSDLYSLGVLLYELATGGNPFVRSRPAASLKAHLGARPPSAVDRAPELSAFLSRVIDTLLAVDPERRFDSAAALHAVLRQAESGVWWRERGTRLHRSPVRVRRDTGVHGRDAELAWLEDAWRTARDGAGRAVFVRGEAGIGKSRLLDEFAARVGRGHAHVLYGSFPPTGGLRGLTAAVVGALDASDLAGSLARLLDEPPELAASYAALLDSGALPEGGPSLGPEALPALCSRIVRALAAERPTLWLVDDLHFAAAEARAAALALARTVDSLPALVVLTSRRAPDAAELAELSRGRGFEQRVLGRLSPREVVDLLREAVRSDALADQLGGRVAHKSDGVPLFVLEMLRSLEEDGSLRRVADGRLELVRTITDVDVPSAVRDLIAGRLAELSRPEREALDVAAVVGVEFDAAQIAAVLERPLVRVLQDLASAERRHGVVRTLGRRHRFDHHQFQEVLYGDLPERLREEYHALVADAHAATLPAASPVTGPDAFVLASHYLRGSRPEAARGHIGPALDHLASHHLSEASLELIDAALERGLADGREHAELLLRAADLLDPLGRRDRQRAVGEEALALATRLQALDLAVRAHLALGGHAMAVYDTGEAISQNGAALEFAQALDDPCLEAAARRALARSLGRVRRGGEARRHLESARQCAEEMQDRHAEALAIHGIGTSFAGELRYEEALEPLERAIVLLAEVGDARAESRAHSSRGSCCLGLGRIDGARRAYERSLALATRAGDRALVANAHGCLGLISLRTGHLAEALRRFRHNHEVSLELGDPGGIGHALANLAYTASLLGDTERALEFAARARDVGDAIDHPRLSAFAVLLRAGMFRNAGDLDAAREETLRSRARLGDVTDRAHEAAVELELGVIAHTSGDDERALAHFLEARSLAQDPAMSLFAAVHLALLGHEAGADAAEDRARMESSLAVPQSMHMDLVLWQATGDRVHLERAHTGLETLRDHAPAEAREGLVDVPINRDIAAAWAAANRDRRGA